MTVVVAMKLRVILSLALLCGFLETGRAQEEAESVVGNEKALRYHKLLLKRPGNATVFGRFVDSWLDTGDKKGLEKWLSGRAEAGESVDWQVLGAFYEYQGEDAKALGALNQAIEKDGGKASLRLSRAKLQARLLAFEAALKDLEAVQDGGKEGVEAAKLKGVYLARSGQVEKAVAAWKEVIAANPKDEELREDLIEMEIVEGLYDDATDAIEELVKMTRDPYKRAVRQLRLADVQVLAGKSEDGIATYEKIMKATGEGTWLEREVMAQIEKVYGREDDAKGLRDFYQKMREAYPRRVSIRKAMARQMAVTGELDEAVALFKEVLKITPGDRKNREEFVSFLEENDMWEEAKTEIEDMLEKRKDDEVLWERLAGVETQIGDEEGVKKALGEVARLRKDSPEGVVAVSQLYHQAELKKEGEALLREGVEAFPESNEIKESLASLLMEVKRKDEAIAIWKKMAEGADREGLLRVARSLKAHGEVTVAYDLVKGRIEDFRRDALVLAQLCELSFTEEQAAECLPHARMLVKQAENPTDLESAIKIALKTVRRAKQDEVLIREMEKEELDLSQRCFLAELYMEIGDSLKSMELLDAAEKEEGGVLVKFYRVRYYENQGDLDRAIATLKEILADPAGRKTVHQRRLVSLYERNGDLPAALREVEVWKRMAPGDKAAWSRRAQLLAIDGRAGDTVKELRRMVGKFGADVDLRSRLARAHLEAGETLEARESLRATL